MKFWNPETGEVFDNIESARKYYCDNNGSTCDHCKISFDKNMLGITCFQYSRQFPAEAARLMGYEVVEDSTETHACNPEDSKNTRVQSEEVHEDKFIAFMYAFKEELKKRFDGEFDKDYLENISGTVGWSEALKEAAKEHLPELWTLWDKLDWWASDKLDSWLIDCADYLGLTLSENKDIKKLLDVIFKSVEEEAYEKAKQEFEEKLKKSAEKLFKTIDTTNGSIACITTDHFGETTEMVENMDKPLKDWTLGEVKKLCAETGMDCEKCPFSVKNEVPPSCRLENDPPDNWDLSERPRWTERDKEDAMMIKRVFNGFQIGIARDTLAQLRTFAKDDYPSEYINSDMFPSLKPGESVTLDEIIGANHADNI